MNLLKKIITVAPLPKLNKREAIDGGLFFLICLMIIVYKLNKT